MADCSKTEEFFSEENRMCGTYNDVCEGCPLGEIVGYNPIMCSDYALAHPKEVIEIVQKWSDEHPAPKPKTYADVFCELLQKTPDCSRWKEEICRKMIWRCNCLKYELPFDSLARVNACITCWDQPYEELNVKD